MAARRSTPVNEKLQGFGVVFDTALAVFAGMKLPVLRRFAATHVPVPSKQRGLMQLRRLLVKTKRASRAGAD